MNREELLEKRRVGFEGWASSEGYSLYRYALVGAYIEPTTQNVWSSWNAALDSVEIELPKAPDCSDEHDELDAGYRAAIRGCAESIKSQGFKIKPRE